MNAFYKLSYCYCCDFIVFNILHSEILIFVNEYQSADGHLNNNDKILYYINSFQIYKQRLQNKLNEIFNICIFSLEKAEFQNIVHIVWWHNLCMYIESWCALDLFVFTNMEYKYLSFSQLRLPVTVTGGICLHFIRAFKLINTSILEINANFIGIFW